MRNWALVLHFYQPSIQELHVTEHVLEVCYLPVLDLLLASPESRFSININTSLIEQLQELGNHTFVEKLQTLVERKQVELLNSPTQHPIAPLLPWRAVERQLKEDLQTTQQTFHIEKLEGVFFPELAIDQTVLDNIEASYNWCVIDESMSDQNYSNTKLPQQFLYQYKNILLPVSSRALTENLRSYPRWINQNKIIDLIENQSTEGATVISANDVELFGHHYSERIHVLRELLVSPRINFITVSEAVAKLEPQQLNAEDLTATSWQTEHEDFENRVPFAKWNLPENKLQQQYLDLITTAYQALSSVEKPENDIGLVYRSAKDHFDHGSASCNLYWLSNDPWWHPELVEIGARDLIKVVRTLSLSRETKLEAEDIYSELIYEMWQYHWSGNVEKGYKKYRSKRERLLSSLADLS